MTIRRAPNRFRCSDGAIHSATTKRAEPASTNGRHPQPGQANGRGNGNGHGSAPPVAADVANDVAVADWNDLLVVPFFDLPGRLAGFLYAGRQLRHPEDFIYRQLWYRKQASAEPQSTLTMLP